MNTGNRLSGARKLLYLVNTGSCGGCDAEIKAAVTKSRQLGWALHPAQADALLLTGPLTAALRPALRELMEGLQNRVPVLAIGNCAINGHPFGRGGVAEMPGLLVVLKLEGCPPTPQAISDAILATLQTQVQE